MSETIKLGDGTTVVNLDSGPVPVAPGLTPTQARALADGQSVVVIGGSTGGGGGAGSQGPRGPEGPEGPEGPRGPRGEDGIDGIDGRDGIDGEDGRDGATPTVEVGQTLTGEPGTPAHVDARPTGTGIALDFTIPRGRDGEDGATASPGTYGRYARGLYSAPPVGEHGWARTFSGVVTTVSNQTVQGTSWSEYTPTETIEIDRLGFTVTTAPAGGRTEHRIGVWAADETGWPTPAGYLGEVAMSITTNGNYIGVLETPVRLEANKSYWFAMSNDTNTSTDRFSVQGLVSPTANRTATATSLQGIKANGADISNSPQAADRAGATLASVEWDLIRPVYRSDSASANYPVPIFRRSA